MSIRQLPDGSYHAIKVYKDTNGQEVAFAGTGATRGECLHSLDAAIATGMKAFPGLAPVYPSQVPTSRLAAIEDDRPGYEPRKPPMWVRSTVTQADGRQSTRIVDYNDYTARKRLHRAGVSAVEAGGGYSIEAAQATLEGGTK